MRYIETEKRIKINDFTRANKTMSKKKLWILISVVVATILIVSGIVAVILYKKGETESVEEKVNTEDELKMEDQNKTPDEKELEKELKKNSKDQTENPQKNKESSQKNKESSQKNNESSQKNSESSQNRTSEDSSENYSLWTENHQREDIKIFTEKVKKMVEYLKTIEKDKCIADLECTSDMYDIFDFTLTDDQTNNQIVLNKCKKEITKSTNKNFTSLIFKFMKYNMLKYIIGDRFAEYFTGKYKDAESYHSFFNDNKNFNLEGDESGFDVDYLELINIISTLYDKDNDMHSVKDVIVSNANMNSPTLTMNVDVEMKKIMQNKKQGNETKDDEDNEEESSDTKLKNEFEIERRRSERLKALAETARKKQEARDRKKSLRAHKKGNK